MKNKFQLIVTIIAWCMIMAAVLGKSTLPPDDPVENVRAFTRSYEFDFVTWTIDAIAVKGEQFALGAQRGIPDDQQGQVIARYLEAVKEWDDLQVKIEDMYSNPNITNQTAAAAPLVTRREQVQALLDDLGPLCETILQQQINAVLSDLNLTLAGQAVPPVLFHATPLPMALIVSPRTTIRQDANISLLPDISIEEDIALENKVESSLDVSALVVPVGGIGTYPTMVKRYAHLPWLVEVISHEWVHNYLTLRPLGINYDASPELRTMNETTASLAEGEIRDAVFRRFYPDYELQPAAFIPEAASKTARPAAVFDFRAEMYQTRLRVDQLLSENKITEAESYMEERRRIFWENGYQIRRLNQAYFAFYGAYADQPGGEAGTDPVGPLVRSLRKSSPSLAKFINRISWMTSFEQLQKAVR